MLEVGQVVVGGVEVKVKVKVEVKGAALVGEAGKGDESIFGSAGGV